MNSPFMGGRPIATTGGSGGIPCEEGTTAVHKIKYCKATIGQNEVRMVFPNDYAQGRPMQVAIFLHWDYWEFLEEEWEEYMLFAKKKNLLFVRVLSSNGRYWWRSLRRARYDFSHTTHLSRLLKTLGEKFNVYKEWYLYSGMSGGSTFLTSQFIPFKGAEFPGVVVANCGGVTPQTRLSRSLTKDIRSRIPIYYKYYSLENIFGAAINSSASWYERNGFPVTVNKVPTEEWLHCEPEEGEEYQKFWVRPTLEIWEKYLIPSPQ